MVVPIRGNLRNNIRPQGGYPGVLDIIVTYRKLLRDPLATGTVLLRTDPNGLGTVVLARSRSVSWMSFGFAMK